MFLDELRSEASLQDASTKLGSAESVVCYEREAPGGLLHIDSTAGTCARATVAGSRRDSVHGDRRRPFYGLNCRVPMQGTFGD